MTIPRTKDLGGRGGRVLAPSTLIWIALLVAACQGAPAATASPSEPSTSAASESAEPSESADAAACLDPDVVAAIEQLEEGDLDTETALTDVADALEALDLDGEAADARDSLVTTLREDAPDETAIVSGIAFLNSRVALPEC